MAKLEAQANPCRILRHNRTPPLWQMLNPLLNHECDVGGHRGFDRVRKAASMVMVPFAFDLHHHARRDTANRWGYLHDGWFQITDHQSSNMVAWSVMDIDGKHYPARMSLAFL